MIKITNFSLIFLSVFLSDVNAHVQISTVEKIASNWLWKAYEKFNRNQIPENILKILPLDLIAHANEVLNTAQKIPVVFDPNNSDCNNYSAQSLAFTEAKKTLFLKMKVNKIVFCRIETNPNNSPENFAAQMLLHEWVHAYYFTLQNKGRAYDECLATRFEVGILLANNLEPFKNDYYFRCID